MTASDPIVISAPANAGANQVRLVKRDGGTMYWSAACGVLRHRHGRRAARLT
jgi:hypothetical protein